MKTAVIYSGQFREFERCWPGQWWQVLRHYGEVTAYFVMQKHADAERLLAPVRARLDGRVRTLLLDDPSFDIADRIVAAYRQAPFTNAAPPRQLMVQHWYQQRAWEFYLSHDDADDETIIRMRGDNLMHEFTPTFPRDASRPGADVLTPFWGRFSGVNDRFAICNRKGAAAYFTVYAQLHALLERGCPFHPESLSAAACESVVLTRDLYAVFSTARPAGHPQHPQRWPEVVPWET